MNLTSVLEFLTYIPCRLIIKNQIKQVACRRTWLPETPILAQYLFAALCVLQLQNEVEAAKQEVECCHFLLLSGGRSLSAGRSHHLLKTYNPTYQTHTHTRALQQWHSERVPLCVLSPVNRCRKSCSISLIGSLTDTLWVFLLTQHFHPAAAGGPGARLSPGEFTQSCRTICMRRRTRGSGAGRFRLLLF